MTTSESTNAVSKDAQAAQPQISRRAPESQPADDRIEDVHQQRGQGGPTEQSRNPSGVSLKRKRRGTADDVYVIDAKNTAAPTNKRQVTDYVQIEDSSTSKSTQAPAVTSAYAPQQSQSAPKVRFSDRTPKPTTFGHANNASKQPKSDTDSEEDRFETAPQFQPSQHPYRAQTRDADDLNSLYDTSLPKVPGHDDDEAEEDEDDDEVFQQLDDWIKARAPSGEATDMMPVIEALRCTSMDTTLADKVLPYLKSGKGVPRNMRGIWTAEDDDRLEGENGRDIAEVHKKHGEELANARLEYLAQRREADS